MGQQRDLIDQVDRVPLFSMFYRYDDDDRAYLVRFHSRDGSKRLCLSCSVSTFCQFHGETL